MTSVIRHLLQGDESSARPSSIYTKSEYLVFKKIQRVISNLEEDYAGNETVSQRIIYKKNQVYTIIQQPCPLHFCALYPFQPYHGIQPEPKQAINPFQSLFSHLLTSRTRDPYLHVISTPSHPQHPPQKTYSADDCSSTAASAHTCPATHLVYYSAAEHSSDSGSCAVP